MIRNLVRCAAAVLVAGGAALTLSGCETVKGAGRDVTNVGEAGSRAINGGSSGNNNAGSSGGNTSSAK